MFETHNTVPLDARSRELRKLVVRAIQGGGRGHVGSSFSLVEIFRVLYDHVLRYNPADPRWSERDRCVLSKGHGCLALYALLADKGFFPMEELDRFCRRDGILGGHPEIAKVPGVEASTGSLGHGLPFGIGFALAARLDGRDSRVFVVSSDGESNEGSAWEAALCAGKHKLASLTVNIDYNKQQSYGATSEVLDLEPFADKWRAFGFAAVEVDGHNVDELRTTFEKLPLDASKPSAIICHTIKGRGVSFAEGNPAWHHKSRVTEAEVAALFAALEGDA